MGRKHSFAGYRVEALDKERRRGIVANTGRDPAMEAEMHMLIAEQKLLDLNRAAAEAAAAEKAKEAAAAQDEAAAAAAAAQEEAAPAAAAAQQEAAPAAQEEVAPAAGEEAH